jgi:hypothetical protein
MRNIMVWNYLLTLSVTQCHETQTSILMSREKLLPTLMISQSYRMSRLNFSTIRTEADCVLFRQLMRWLVSIFQVISVSFRSQLTLYLGSLFELLEEQGQLDNTYIFYSADNG